MSIKIITGPKTSKVSKDEAIEALKSNPNFPKEASFSVEDVEGRWVAAFEAAAPPDFEVEEVSVDEDTLDDSSSDDSDDSDGFSIDSEDGPESEDSEDSETSQLDAIKNTLDSICQALGVDPESGGVDGLDDIPGIAEEAPPEAAPNEAQRIIHEKSMGPGDVPPGGTPLGAPAFASVSDDNPWKKAAIDGVEEFPVKEKIGSTPLNSVRQELKQYAEEIGYRVAQLDVSSTDGIRVASAIIQKA